jgi:hypothetical protein
VRLSELFFEWIQHEAPTQIEAAAAILSPLPLDQAEVRLSVFTSVVNAAVAEMPSGYKEPLLAYAFEFAYRAGRASSPCDPAVV